MVAKKKNYAARSLKAVRMAKAMPMQRIELSGSVRNVAKVLSDMGLAVSKSKVRIRNGYDGVFVVKGVAGRDACSLTDDITLVKTARTGKSKGAGKTSAKVIMSNKRH